mgnify:FL=1
MSKGCKRRRAQVNRKTFSDNWDKIFNKPSEAKDSGDKENGSTTKNTVNK